MPNISGTCPPLCACPLYRTLPPTLLLYPFLVPDIPKVLTRLTCFRVREAFFLLHSRLGVYYPLLPVSEPHDP